MNSQGKTRHQLRDELVRAQRAIDAALQHLDRLTEAPEDEDIPVAQQRAKELIQHFEGLRLYTYKDPAGVKTIGWGHTGPIVGQGLITKERARELLAADMETARASVMKLITVDLTNNQLWALVCFVFNIGHGQFETSTLRRILNEGNYAGVPEQLRRWVWYTAPDGTKHKSAGLVRRRKATIRLWNGE